ncbi:MAG: type II secretion system F family protein [Bacteriovoracaceae bacterium]|nr:type II secretion system F family protein [Bacteriovoracaceae bacterium]
MDFLFTQVLGKSGVMLAVGALVFFYINKNSEQVFRWIEDQTYGTRDYVLSKCELIFYEIAEEKVTYILLFLSFGLSSIVFGICAIFGLFGLGVVAAGVVGFVGWKIPRPFMDFLVNKRTAKFETQMVDALNLLANGVRAGLSLPQALGMVVDELPAPVSQEFNLILQQNKIGVPLDECFENLVKRVPTEDNQMFVTSISILRETGGNLAEVFDTIIEVIRERIKIKQKIDGFTAQSKFQGGFMSLMPTLMLIMYSQSDPESTKLLFTKPLGIIILIVVYTLTAIGGYAIIKITKIEV